MEHSLPRKNFCEYRGRGKLVTMFKLLALIAVFNPGLVSVIDFINNWFAFSSETELCTTFHASNPFDVNVSRDISGVSATSRRQC